MEGVHCQHFGAEYLVEEALYGDAHGVGTHMSVGLLAMLERGRSLLIDVLIELATERCSHHLQTATNAKDGYLTVGGKTHQHQLVPVACRIDGTEFAQRLLTQVKGVDVTTTRKNKGIYTVKQADHGIGIVTWRDDEWCATCLEHRTVISFEQCTFTTVVVARNADDGLTLMVGE